LGRWDGIHEIVIKFPSHVSSNLFRVFIGVFGIGLWRRRPWIHSPPMWHTVTQFWKNSVSFFENLIF
jgi:hypothetical protein